MNIVAFGTDSYKQSHHTFYPDGLEIVYSYCEPRVGGRFKEIVANVGLQAIIGNHFTGQVVTQEKIDEAADICEAHFGSAEVFNRAGWEHILAVHDGRLPVIIKALPEGTVVPEGTALFTIENTDPQVPWLTNFLETILMQVWAPITVATSSREIRKIILASLEKTGTPADLPFKLHDFGYRGVSSVETATILGAAHLLSGAMGTDTMASLAMLRDCYGAEDMPAFSIPATEHSVMTAGGPDGEADIVRRVLKAHPKGLVALVIDSFDTINFIKNVIGGNEDIMEMICNREGTVVFRPDSGELPHIDIDVYYALEEVFGSTVNDKGFEVLPPYVRMIQGDGIKWYRPLQTDGGGHGMGATTATYGEYRHTIQDILQAFEEYSISADNIAFGSGGGLLQDFNRDTQNFAIKCSAMKVNGEWRDIYKQPKTDSAKNSKRGRLIVLDTDKGITTLTLEEAYQFEEDNMLKTIFFHGDLEKQTLNDIRERCAL